MQFKIKCMHMHCGIRYMYVHAGYGACKARTCEHVFEMHVLTRRTCNILVRVCMHLTIRDRIINSRAYA
jgi:hypothetical protein